MLTLASHIHGSNAFKAGEETSHSKNLKKMEKEPKRQITIALAIANWEEECDPEGSSLTLDSKSHRYELAEMLAQANVPFAAADVLRPRLEAWLGAAQLCDSKTLGRFVTPCLQAERGMIAEVGGLFVCLFICLFVYLFVYLFICLFVFFICLFIYLFLYLFVCFFICLFISFFLSLFVCLFVSFFICLFLSLFPSFFLSFFLSF